MLAGRAPPRGAGRPGRAARARRAGAATGRARAPRARRSRSRGVVDPVRVRDRPRRGATRSARPRPARARPGAAAGSTPGRPARRTAAAKPEQAEDGQRAGRLLDVEALDEMGDRRRDHERDRELPGAALAAREPAGEPEQTRARTRASASARPPARPAGAGRARTGCDRPSRASAPTTIATTPTSAVAQATTSEKSPACGPCRRRNCYSRTRIRRSSSSLPGSRIASTESPGSSCVNSSGTSPSVAHDRDQARPLGQPHLPHGLAGANDFSPTVISTISRFSFFSSSRWMRPCSGTSCSIRPMIESVAETVGEIPSRSK